MIFGELNHITLSGVEYPIKCDLLVLERIQEEFGTVKKFDDEILNWEYADDDTDKEPKDRKIKLKEPSVHAVNFSLPLMINEGIEIENEMNGQKREKVKPEDIVRKVDMTMFKIAEIIHNEFNNCFVVKNQQTTQSQT